MTNPFNNVGSHLFSQLNVISSFNISGLRRLHSFSAMNGHITFSNDFSVYVQISRKYSDWLATVYKTLSPEPIANLVFNSNPVFPWISNSGDKFAVSEGDYYKVYYVKTGKVQSRIKASHFGLSQGMVFNSDLSRAYVCVKGFMSGPLLRCVNTYNAKEEWNANLGVIILESISNNDMLCINSFPEMVIFDPFTRSIRTSIKTTGNAVFSCDNSTLFVVTENGVSGYSTSNGSKYFEDTNHKYMISSLDNSLIFGLTKSENVVIYDVSNWRAVNKLNTHRIKNVAINSTGTMLLSASESSYDIWGVPI